MELVERVKQARSYEEKLYGELRENPIDLDALFDAVVKTVHYNYVGYEQKKQYFTPAEYHTYVFSHYRYQTLTVQMLVRSLHQFVGDLHDRHLRFHCDDWIDYRNLSARFSVRASEEVLYVTWAMPDTGLRPGDKILKIQGMTPQRVRKLTRNHCFYSSQPERELWGGYLRMAQSLTVEHEDGSVETRRMRLCPASEETRSISQRFPVRMRRLDPVFYKDAEQTGQKKVLCLELQRMDTETIHTLILQHREELERADQLVIDLRRCIGGEEGAGWELFPYLLDRPRPLSELIGDEGSYVLCTEDNCKLRLAQLQAGREKLTREAEGSDEALEMLAMVDREIDFFRENAGKGLTFRPAEPIEEELLYPAPRAPRKVVLLTDTFCENEGEQFAAMCRRCGEKVMTIGRPTMGSLDYFDTIELQVHEHMTLTYPIRMTKAAYEGRGISEKGLDVDEYLPWTPEEIHRDVILERALEIGKDIK